MKRHVDVTFHPSWWYKHAGVEFDEKFWFDADYRVAADRRMRRTLYEYFGEFGLGEKDPQARPILFSDLLANFDRRTKGKTTLSIDFNPTNL